MNVKTKLYSPQEQFSSTKTCKRTSGIFTLLELLRVKQWIKNGFVLIPLFIQFHMLESYQILKAFIACLLFCGVSSAVYIFNDLMDVQEDKMNSNKKFRPIASGAVSKTFAITIGIVLCATMLAIGYAFSIYCGAILTIYILLNLMYSLKLRNITFIDLFVISAGFVLRVILGFTILNITWYETNYMCFSLFIMFGTLFIGMGKRKGEMLQFSNDVMKCRASLKKLSLEDMNQIISILIACTITSYILFVVESNVKVVYFSVPLLLLGILRYQFLLKDADVIGKPEKRILSDRPIIVCILLWAIFFLGIDFLIPNID